MTEITAQSIDEALRAQLASLEMGVDSREVGTVIQVGDGIARVDGLKSAMAGELLEFIGEGGKIVYGLVQNLVTQECYRRLNHPALHGFLYGMALFKLFQSNIQIFSHNRLHFCIFL